MPVMALGIYLHIAARSPPALRQAALGYISDPGVSGFSLEAAWADVEPSDGVFDWSAIDTLALPTAAAGKPVAVAIIAGGYTPAWLYAPPYSVPNADFLNSLQAPTYICQSADQPAPWNAQFQAAFATMQQALAAHLSAAGVTVSQVKLTGLNHLNAELNMETMQKPIAGSPCPFTDATTVWQLLGYLPALAETAAGSAYGAVQAAFPGVVAVLPYIAANAMPRIGANGRPTTSAQAQAIFTSVAGAAVAGGAGVQWDSLSAYYPIPAVWLQQVAGGAYGVLQTSEFEAGQPGTPCAPIKKGPYACSDAVFGQGLQAGIAAGARMIEVWPGDFIYEDQIAAANAALTGGAQYRVRQIKFDTLPSRLRDH